MGQSVVRAKSAKFALRIVRLHAYLKDERHEYTISKQILRAGTSIGANIHEAQQAQSKKDFLSKMNIALKEASETKYWLTLLREGEYLSNKQYDSIYPDCTELEKMLTSIVKTTRKNLN